MSQNEFIEELSKINIFVTEEQLVKFEKYYEMLIEWNNKINLTTIVIKEEVYLKHFYDSATITKIIDLNEEESLCDVGTGAGLPGIVLKILFPHLKITLIDSLNKRIKFLEAVINELNLTSIVAIHGRIEDFGKLNREKFDIVTARAVAPLNLLLEYCIPITKINKYFIPMKANISQEILDSKSALKTLNSEINEQIEFKLIKEDSTRTLLKIKKQMKTEKKYPRNFGQIKKNPL